VIINIVPMYIPITQKRAVKQRPVNYYKAKYTPTHIG